MSRGPEFRLMVILLKEKLPYVVCLTEKLYLSQILGRNLIFLNLYNSMSYGGDEIFAVPFLPTEY